MSEIAPAETSSKPTIQMDRLLDVVVKQDASDLHLSCGRPPTIRLSGRLRNLATKVLEPEDMLQLMKSITPERNQQELQEVGGTDFGFAFGTAARFRVSVFKQKGVISMVLRQIPNRLLSFDQIGLPEICKDLIRRCRRPKHLFGEAAEILQAHGLALLLAQKLAGLQHDHCVPDGLRRGLGKLDGAKLDVAADGCVNRSQRVANADEVDQRESM